MVVQESGGREDMMGLGVLVLVEHSDSGGLVKIGFLYKLCV